MEQQRGVCSLSYRVLHRNGGFLENPFSHMEKRRGHNILSLSSGIDEVGSLRWTLVLWAILLKVIVIVSLLKSVKSVGKLMIFATFFPPLIGLAMLIQAFTQKGAKDGLLFLITPDFTKLADSKVWIEASFMAFYSVGPGWGGVLMMGSHMKFHSNCLSCEGQVNFFLGCQTCENHGNHFGGHQSRVIGLA
ncbi:sodium-dependent proline transporter-like [Pecten maximus]|uniref:sodium-dependent proline transporter-like n=1 Tax=Pecten maximus TaxID=6579 RepID=UPI00145910CA|nr:sodium-dependent proline transporter-like [Pecten maximus]